MHFFKKAIYGLMFVGASLCANPQQDVVTILQRLGNAISDELSRAPENDVAQVKQFVERELPAIKTKVAYAAKHDLTKTQRATLLHVLQNCKKLAAYTTDDLMKMAEVCSTAKGREALNKAFEVHFSKKLVDKVSKEDIEKIEKADLGNPSFNLLKNYMCAIGYMNDESEALALADLAGYCNEVRLQQICIEAGTKFAVPFVVFNDQYFFPGWQDAFKEVGQYFAIMHVICSQLIEAIEQYK
jgi:hypothetical protein